MSQTAVSSVGQPGWYGKLPHLGDFASRRLPDDFVRRWDGWLQCGLAHARGELGDAWLATYLVAPVRRFWLAPGVTGSGGWAGVLMPSVDRVGRHFPLTVLQPLERLDAALAARDWYRAVDAAARRVLDLSFTVEDLEHDLAALPAPPEVADEPARRLAGALDGATGSVWWCDDAREPAQLLSFAGLPPDEAFVLLLRGPP